MRNLIFGLLIVASSAFASLAQEQAGTPTRTLGRVFTKLKAGQPFTIAYFGGSITAAPGYRVQVTKWFPRALPRGPRFAR